MNSNELLRVLSSEEQRKVIEAADKNDLGIGIYLALITGIRLGELCNLKWKHVDFDNQIIRIEREIPIDSCVLSSLSEYKKQQKVKSEFVLSLNDGNRFNLKGLGLLFKEILKQSGVKNISFTCLRYTFIFNLIENEMPIENIIKVAGYARINNVLGELINMKSDKRISDN